MKINGSLVTLGLCLVAASFLAQAQTSLTCTAATLSGTHSLVLTGRDVLPSAVLSRVYQGVGTATFDGVGAVTFNLTSNTNQSAGTVQTLSGTYSLPSNCLGTLNITTGDTASFTLIPFNQGKNFTITGQDGTYAFTGSGGLAPVTCLNSTLSGAYTFTGNGFALASGAIGGVDTISGLFQFDGVGSVTGNWSIDTSGTTAPDTFTGQYSVSSSCVASGTVTDPNGSAMTLSFTITSADGANFGVLLANPTNTFTATGHSTFTNPGLAVGLAAGANLPATAGSLFIIYGSDLATGEAQFTKFPLPATLKNATVTVNGETAPLDFVEPGLIIAQMPWDIQPGVATLVVTNETSSNAVAITVPATAVPGVLADVNNHAIAQNFPSYSLNSSTNPANVGDVVVVYLLGGGPVQNENLLTTGGETPGQLFPVTEDYSATIGGVKATVEYVGLVEDAIGGFYFANIVVPKVAAGDRNMVLTIGGKASNVTAISVK